MLSRVSVDRVLAVPRDEIARREKEYRKGVDANPEQTRAETEG